MFVTCINDDITHNCEVRSSSNDATVTQVEEILIHPEYKWPFRPKDVAVVSLSSEVRWTSGYTGPVCLPDRVENLTGKEVDIAGWG